MKWVDLACIILVSLIFVWIITPFLYTFAAVGSTTAATLAIKGCESVLHLFKCWEDKHGELK